MATLQTLERGLRTLEIVAASNRPLSVAQLAKELHVHRTIAYRIVRTLQAEGFIHSDASSGLHLGKAIPALFEAFGHDLPSYAQTVLDELSRQAGATCVIVAVDGDECVPVRVAARNDGPIQVSYRLGMRHSIHQGAAGIALFSLRAPGPDEPPEVETARANGYAISSGVLQPGARGVFMPMRDLGMALGIVSMREIDLDEVLPFLRAAAAKLQRR